MSIPGLVFCIAVIVLGGVLAIITVAVERLADKEFHHDR